MPDQPANEDSLPVLRSIHDPRHPGLTIALCHSYAESAEVCMARHHASPVTTLRVECCGSTRQRDLHWTDPNATMLRAYNNRDDATRDGAYVISLAAVERELGLVALGRVETRMGADFYVGDQGAEDLEQAYRLEVSGVDAGGSGDLRSRLRQKIQQALDGESDLPAYAAVVGYSAASVLIAEVKAA